MSNHTFSSPVQRRLIETYNNQCEDPYRECEMVKGGFQFDDILTPEFVRFIPVTDCSLKDRLKEQNC